MPDAPLSPSTDDLLEAAVSALGGARRKGQVRMAQAVSTAMERERHLAVQAGTGTGKSLAYLVPALRHAQATGTTVIVSTATIALQKQLVDRDLPRLADALEPLMEHRPTFAIQKGRSNYLCLNKIAREEPEEQEALLDEEELGWLGRQMRRVTDWAQETETGDRDDLEPGVPDQVWRHASVTSNECVGATRCPHGEECFAELARQATRNVDVVVTNHALLAIDALSDAPILPEHEVVIVDEAHELDGRITAVATAHITVTALNLAAKRAGKLGADGQDAKLTEATKAWDSHVPALEPGRWTSVDDHTRTLLVSLRDEIWATRSRIAKAPEGEATNAPETFAERHNLSAHLLELHDALVRMLGVFETSDPSEQSDVVWLTVDERRGTSLTVAPLSVAGLLHTRLFAENTVVLTSATLSVGGNFQALAAAWGLPKVTWDGIDVGTPFDPQRSGIMYVPTALPDPGREGPTPETLDEMAELITAAGGRTLGLFSSRRAAQIAAEKLRPRLPFDILLQGEDSTGALVDNFARNENTCLFGTLTLWQGVDVPGRSCSLVLIDRIPFPRPDDPLLQARKEAADAEGRNGFMEVAATHAALLLAQGAGRLLRSVNDKGVVAVLDRRIVTKRYGGFLSASMPQFWATSDGEKVRGALRRLVAS
ncbi:ATP-dependent DNA helicase [Corynebacterium lowii]|uniref:ATP-dependent helicase DinG n=1 Tax=Corynebacterium lowii TaxID=1544413 RepID=A0A0Q0Z5R7_9CORY|nr:ATP-dependent DNA helicase [Corynebacterium lowii]KQB84851.1 putative ATP-dependent helicase DinG [Corynebacterium lowii]MDP9851755.1 ATP-dependent DNA helicase DinG [Corynebacterium lowii]